MCETMQSSHRLRHAMALVRALLAPTESGDGAGERFCAPLPPSPHFSGAYVRETDEFLFFLEHWSIFWSTFWSGTTMWKALKSRWSRVGTSKIIS
jgi:hypothetical protein